MCLTGSYVRQIGFCCDTFNNLIFNCSTANKAKSYILHMHADLVVCVKKKKKSVICAPFRMTTCLVWFGLYGACTQLKHTVVNWPGPFSKSSVPSSGT